MSIKHVKDYYRQMFTQYREMEADIHDLEEAVSNNIVQPEVLEQAIKTLDKLKENYQRINYIMFLFYMPNKPAKQVKYTKRMDKVLKAMPESAKLDAVKDENAKCLKAFETATAKLNETV